MVFKETKIAGLVEILLEPLRDERGFFARTWCAREFQERGLNTCIAQCNVSYNASKGTLRGIHYQAFPDEEAKLIRCTRGRLYDVAVDLRQSSRTFREWVAFELSPDNDRMIYIPEGVGHGFQTLMDSTEIVYQMSTFYKPESARGIRWDDAAFNITWPLQHPIMSDRDRAFPNFETVR